MLEQLSVDKRPRRADTHCTRPLNGERSNQVSAETELGGSEGAWAGAYGGEGQCYTRRCPCNPAPNTFQTSGINSFASPFLSSSQICTKAEQVHQKQQRETLGEAGCARTGVGVGRGSPVQQAVAECDQPSRLARQRSDVLERLRCPCANAGQINVEAEI